MNESIWTFHLDTGFGGSRHTVKATSIQEAVEKVKAILRPDSMTADECLNTELITLSRCDVPKETP